jgi:hypothetical protein
MDLLAEDASNLIGVGGDFAETGRQVNATWQGLAGVYKAPEVGALLAATAPIQSVSSSVGSDIKAVGSALAAYAAEVRQIKARLAQLKTEAQNFVSSVKDDDDWNKDQGKVDTNNNLINAVSAEMAQFFEAQRRCANAINALYGGTQYTAVSGDKPKEGEYGYTADQLKEATKAGADLPWGKAEEHDEGFWGGVKHFFGGVGDGFMDMVKGLGGLIGWGENGWSWSNAGHAWGGLGKFALALGIYSPAGAILDNTVGVPGFKRGEMGQTLLNAGKGLIAWDDWSKDPARAGGKATFNIVTAVVGTKGAGAAMRGVGAAAEGSRIAALARAGTLLVRAGETIGELPTVTDLAISAGRKFSGIFDAVKGALHFDGASKIDVPPTHINEPAPHPHPTEHTPQPRPGSVGDNLGQQPTIPHESPINEPAHVGAGHDTPSDPHTGGGDHGGGDPGGSDHGGSDLGGDHGGSDPGGSDPGGSDPGGSDHGGSDPGGSDPGGSDHGGSDPGGSDHSSDPEGGQPQPHNPAEPPPGVTFDDPKHPNLGSDGKYYVKEGVDHDVPIDEPGNVGRTITDIDRPQDGVLWEEKSAVNALDVDKWVNKQVNNKIEAYIEARQYIGGYENAPVGIEFTRVGADPAFRAAVEKAIADLRIKHPDVTILVKWAE